MRTSDAPRTRRRRGSTSASIRSTRAPPSRSGRCSRELAGEGVIRRAIVGGTTTRSGPARAPRVPADPLVVPHAHRARRRGRAAAFPDGIEVRTLRGGEERQAYDAYTASFADHWEFSRTLRASGGGTPSSPRAFDPTLWFLAEPATRSPASRSACCTTPAIRGTGGSGSSACCRRSGARAREALLRHAFAEFARRGCTRVSLGVDAENTTGAVGLYERAGMRQIRRSDTWERRP